MLNCKTALLYTFISVFVIACANSDTGNNKAEQNAQAAAPDTSKKSLPMQTTKRINNAQITIKYHSPGMRGRIIWGGLVPYDQVWVTGAHNATSFEISGDFKVGDKKIPAGKYALFTIPGKEEWTVIINKNWQQHLTDEYAETDDVVRVKVKPELLTENVERLKYEIDQTGEYKANIVISWEKLKIPFSIRID
jgi:hypothetical protein